VVVKALSGRGVNEVLETWFERHTNMLFPKPHFTETTTFDRGEDMQLTSNNRHSRAESESKVMDYASMSGSVMGHRGGGEDNNVLDEWNCNVHDRKDMARLGKTQQLKVIRLVMSEVKRHSHYPSVYSDPGAYFHSSFYSCQLGSSILHQQVLY